MYGNETKAELQALGAKVLGSVSKKILCNWWKWPGFKCGQGRKVGCEDLRWTWFEGLTDILWKLFIDL